jgi:hypothetical protein
MLRKVRRSKNENSFEENNIHIKGMKKRKTVLDQFI